MADKEHLKKINQGPEEWNKWRVENPTLIPDLSDAMLSEIDLQGANFRWVNLERGNLSAANLGGVDLFWANLRQADLRNAILAKSNLGLAKMQSANLHSADLSGANLREAALDGANLTLAILKSTRLAETRLVDASLVEADLTETIFSRSYMFHTNLDRAHMCWTVLGDLDLSDVKGLNTVQHAGPSTLGADTILRSLGKIPEVFLRGVGLPDDLITYLPSLLMQAIEFYSCFISYSHADRSFARRLHDNLQGHGIRCWLDEHELLPGDKIYTQVDRGIRLWDKVLLCCSKDALTSWWVDNEIKIAFDKEQQLWRQRGKEVLALIPLNLDDYLFSGAWQSGLATEVKARLAADFSGWTRDNNKFDDQMERLIKSLRTDSRGHEPPPPKLV